ncbi:MAG: hypothetical protein FWE35_01755 [Streptosporangiales bacterium]|nr:hypothetical protein [Streptosporangiales bacterium]
MIILTAALCALVASEAHGQVTAAVNGGRAVFYLRQAETSLKEANTAAKASDNDRYIQLAGSGTDFQNNVTAATQELLLAAENNAAGPLAATTIQFSEGLLVVYTGLIQQAGIDYQASGGPGLTKAELGYATNLLDGSQGIQVSLHGLIHRETGAVRAAEDSAWLSPAVAWPVLFAPCLAALLIAACTSSVLWRGYRRLISGRLTAAVTAELFLAALVASLDTRDSGQLSRYFRPLVNGQQAASVASPATVNASYAFFWWTLAAGLLLMSAALVLAYTSYRPRLREYRYPR